MTKTTRNTASAAEDSFNKHYAAIWGETRWDSGGLFRALSQPTRYAALRNRYAPASDFWQALEEARIPRRPVPWEHAPRDIIPDGSETYHNFEEDLPQLPFPKLSGHGHDEAQAGNECHGRVVKNRRLDEPGHMVETFESNDFPHPKPAPSHKAHLMTHWNLDGASVLVAHLLDVHPGDSVLDLCAAPGGKSIALAQKLWPEYHADVMEKTAASGVNTSRLVSNEVDNKRQKRLAENLQAYFPPRLFQNSRVTCTKVDATGSTSAVNILLASGSFDKVLVDGPCSSERHIIHANIKAKAVGKTANEMTNWRPGNAKKLAKTQLELLMNALRAVKVGGQVMYATCSIEPTENDGVVEKMLGMVEKERKKGGRWDARLGFDGNEKGEEIEEALKKWAERTKYGWIVLPDHPEFHRWGPLFFCRISKVDGR